jgi:hypothetical protein
MGDLRPLGSEKLQGTDKLKRIMEIAKYNEVPKQEVNELATTNYTIRLADGNLYGIVKERAGYIIKKGLDESTLDYSEPMKNRRYYRSYADAMKKLNLVVSEVNRNEGNEFEIPLIGEQPKKKFILKTPKPAAPAGDDLPPPPAASAETPPPPPPAKGGTEGMPPPPPPAEGGAEGMPPPPPAEGDMGDVPPAPEEGEMGDMGELPPAPEEGEMGDIGELPPAPEEDMGDMGNEDEEVGPSGLKMIQKLTGKLSQKIRTFDKDKGMDSQDIKYVINSILSAIDMKNLDDDDREEIVDKIEGFDDEYGAEGEGDLNLSGDEDFGMGMGDEMPVEDGTDEMPAEDGTDEIGGEPKEGYQSVMDSIFAESKVEKVLSKYFDVKTDEKPILEHRNKMNYLQEKIQKIQQKKDLVEFSVSDKQKRAALTIFEGYENTVFVGKTNKDNLVFKVNGKEVKVTPNGRTI